VAEELGIRWVIPQQLSYLACVAVHRDEPERATELMAAAERHLVECGPQFGLEVLMWARALLLERAGDVAQAAELLGQGWSLPVSCGYLLQGLELGPDLVRLSLAAGDRPQAERACETVEEVALRAGLASGHGVALRCRGLLEGSEELLLEAVAALRRGGRLLELAFACEDAGTALAGRRPEAAVALLDEAIDRYRRIGARRDLARAASTLRGLGARPRPPAAPRRARVGWPALTETEQRVAALTARGLTNREVGSHLFISPRTVETHLSHVFGKLGVSSRVELAAAYAREEARERSVDI